MCESFCQPPVFAVSYVQLLRRLCDVIKGRPLTTGLNIDRRGDGLFHRKLTVGPVAPPDRRRVFEPTRYGAPRVIGPIRKECLIEPKMPKLSSGNLSLIGIVGATRRQKSCIWNNKGEKKSEKEEKMEISLKIFFLFFWLKKWGSRTVIAVLEPDWWMRLS